MSEQKPFNMETDCLHTIFEDNAKHNPNNIALRSNGLSYTYDTLNNDSNQLAQSIINTLGEGTSNVAILIENSYEQVLAILAILKAGKCYVPLEIDFPVPKSVSLINDAACSMLITIASHKGLAKELLIEDSILFADDLIKDKKYENPGLKISPYSPAYIPYTSGSTGKPKGAVHTHQSMVHLIKRTNNLAPASSEDVVGCLFSFAFSAHALPLFVSLLNGCTLSMLRISANKLSGVTDWLLEEKISIVLLLPSFVRHMTASIDPETELSSLKHLYLGGESLYRSDIIKLKPNLSDHTRLINLYASTECYVCSALIFDKHSVIRNNIIPIGFTVEDVDVDIIDEKGHVLGPNESGTIQIRSKYISRGYNSPELNEACFSRDKDEHDIITFKTSDIGYRQDDGCFVHTGREENYVKLRGYRIELKEIENILLEREDVKEAICVVKKNPAEADHIIAYVVPAGGSHANIDILRDKMVRRLPDYMIPTHIIELPEMTRLSSGKIDSSKLPEPQWELATAGNDIIPPRTTTETELTAIFENSLKIKPIGVTTNFLKIGADSLSLFLVLSKVEKKFGTKLKIDGIMENPTIEALAVHITKLQE